MTDLSGSSGAAGFRRPRVLALANQKGGVGKTTTAINLGTALAAIGEKVLILDLDPQGNASTGLGIDRKHRRVSTYHVITGEASLASAVAETAVPRLCVAPSTLDLLGVELEIAHERNRLTACGRPSMRSRRRQQRTRSPTF
jgi:chromosome partitioning protein